MAGGAREAASAGNTQRLIDDGRPRTAAAGGEAIVSVEPLPARQVALPSLGALVRPRSETSFAHPAERHLAQLLTFYGVRWSYEPTTFALSRAGEDRGPAFFAPDFYLPEHRLYIELTTMRQRLVTRKNRKLRRLRELYPGVGIKLLYRRDYLQLVAAYDHAAGDADREQIGRVLCTEEAIAARIRALAEEIATDLEKSASEPPLLVGVGRGSERFHTALGAALAARGVAVEHDRIELTRFNPAGPSQRARVQRPPTRDLTSRPVLLIEDVVSTGLSLAFLVDWLRRRGARAVSACTLLNRSEARLLPVPVRHVGFNVPTAILAGYGLSLRPRYADLPYIATVTSGAGSLAS